MWVRWEPGVGDEGTLAQVLLQPRGATRLMQRGRAAGISWAVATAGTVPCSPPRGTGLPPAAAPGPRGR